MAQTWSLVVELTFYAALPLYVLLAERLARGRASNSWLRLELVLLAVIAVVSVWLHFEVSEAGLPGFFTGTLLGYMLWFAPRDGARAGLGRGSRRPAPGRGRSRLIGRHAVAAVGDRDRRLRWLSLAVPATPFLLTPDQLLAIHLAFGGIAFLLMLPAVFGDDRGGLPRRLLAHPVMAWLGLVSYGIFLWHYVVTLELGSPGAGWAFAPLLLATLAISITCAAISYYALERPLLRFKR